MNMKNVVFCDVLNTDADFSFANVAAWNTGRKVVDLRNNRQMVDRVMLYINVRTAGTTITFQLQEASTNSEASFAAKIPFHDQYSAANVTITTTAGLYAAEYRDLKRYLRLSAVSSTGTYVLDAWVVGFSLKNPIDQSVLTFM